MRSTGRRRSSASGWLTSDPRSDRGLTRDEAMDELTDLTDRFPMEVGQDDLAPKVMRLNVANLYDYLTGVGIHTPA